MPCFLPLSDRLWLNLEQVLYVQQADPNGALIVQLAAGPDTNGRLPLRPSEAARLLHHLRADPREPGPAEGEWVETWRIVENYEP